jgi:hypothetical protein
MRKWAQKGPVSGTGNSYLALHSQMKRTAGETLHRLTKP